jgi:hypothetical protein
MGRNLLVLGLNRIDRIQFIVILEFGKMSYGRPSLAWPDLVYKLGQKWLPLTIECGLWASLVNPRTHRHVLSPFRYIWAHSARNRLVNPVFLHFVFVPSFVNVESPHDLVCRVRSTAVTLAIRFKTLNINIPYK